MGSPPVLVVVLCGLDSPYLPSCAPVGLEVGYPECWPDLGARLLVGSNSPWGLEWLPLVVTEPHAGNLTLGELASVGR